jgi:hypothetical protein
MSSAIDLYSQINLFLRITARRADGYHDLASLFHVIDFGDMIKFSKAPTKKDSLTTNHPDVPLDDSNLIIKVPPPSLSLLAPLSPLYLALPPSLSSLLSLSLPPSTTRTCRWTTRTSSSRRRRRPLGPALPLPPLPLEAMTTLLQLLSLRHRRYTALSA